METKISDERNQTTGMTTIECINDTKFQSIRRVRQLKDAELSLHTNKRQVNEKLEAIIESIAHQANEMQEFVSKAAKTKRTENAAHKFLHQHQRFLADAVGKLRDIAAGGIIDNCVLPHASTPYRSTRNATTNQITFGSPLRVSSEWEHYFAKNKSNNYNFGHFSSRRRDK